MKIPDTMPFGKFEGEYICFLKTDYIFWCIRNLTDVDLGLRHALQMEWARRPMDERQRVESRANRSSSSRSRSYGSSGYSSGYGSSGYSTAGSHLPVSVSVDTALQLVKAGRRALAQQMHPDRGGSHELMVAANATADYLEEALPQMMGGRA